MAKNIHGGHRKRVKDEFRARGLEGMPDHRVLELVLFYSLPQGDVNPLAHRLIDTFGSLSGVLDATEDELLAVDGVGEHTVTLLKLFPAVGGYYQKKKAEFSNIITSSWDIQALMAPYFFGARNEQVFLACLDGKQKLLGVRKLGEGIVNSAEITCRKVMEAALSLNSSVVILAHNHTSGIASMSKEDVITTHILYEALRQVEIQLLDHVIVVDEDMVSMRESGVFSNFER